MIMVMVNVMVRVQVVKDYILLVLLVRGKAFFLNYPFDKETPTLALYSSPAPKWCPVLPPLRAGTLDFVPKFLELTVTFKHSNFFDNSDTFAKNAENNKGEPCSHPLCSFF